MSVLVRFGRQKAILRVGKWLSADVHLERQLNDSTSTWIQSTGGPPLSDPDQEQTVAREIAARFGGRILLHMKSRLPLSSRYFFEQRQMTLHFDRALPMQPQRKRRAAAAS